MSELYNRESGPFGHYPHACVGRLLNIMSEQEKIPLNRIYDINVGNDSLSINGQRIGTYRWYGDQAIFRWYDTFAVYNRQNFIQQQDGTLKPDFRMSLTVHNTPGFEITGKGASEKLHEFLHYPMLTNYMDHECYKLSKKVGAFFQGGAHDPKGEWFLIEFWSQDLAAVQKWIDYLNENYKPNSGTEGE